MARVAPESQERASIHDSDQPELERLLELSFSKAASQAANSAGKAGQPTPAALTSEEDLLREAILALRAMRYGSVLLTVHEGQLVEITKTVRLRRSVGASPGKEKENRNQREG